MPYSGRRLSRFLAHATLNPATKPSWPLQLHFLCRYPRYCYEGNVYSQRRNLLTLAIETSCDDTAVAVLETTGNLNPRNHQNNYGGSKSSMYRASNRNSTPYKERTASLTQDAGASSQNDAVSQGVSARILFHEKITARNTGLGGIHPVEALESHQANLATLVSKAVMFLPNADTDIDTARIEAESSHGKEQFRPKRTIAIDHGHGEGQPVTRIKILPDFITVTRGPGMRSNLACGIDTAKGLAAAWQVPLLGVHHMQAHALTPRLVDALERGHRIQEGKQQRKQEEQQNQVDEKKIGPLNGQAIDSSHLSNGLKPDSQAEAYQQNQQRLQPQFPFLTLLVSGGHTMLVHSKGLVDHQIIANTRDIAIGDALDKCGRIILPEKVKSKMQDTAFAKYLSEWASQVGNSADLWPVPKKRKSEIVKPKNEFGWQMQAPLADTRDMAFSFSGIATNIERLFKERSCSADGYISLDERLTFARTALGVSFEHLGSRIVIALENLRAAGDEVSTLVVSGGVAANSFLRLFLRTMLDARGFQDITITFPPPWLCTDNAVMIAWTGIEMFEAGFQSEMNIRAVRKWSMDPTAVDGGVVGIGGWVHRAQLPSHI